MYQLFTYGIKAFLNLNLNIYFKKFKVARQNLDLQIVSRNPPFLCMLLLLFIFVFYYEIVKFIIPVQCSEILFYYSRVSIKRAKLIKAVIVYLRLEDGIAVSDAAALSCSNVRKCEILDTCILQQVIKKGKDVNSKLFITNYSYL